MMNGRKAEVGPSGYLAKDIIMSFSFPEEFFATAIGWRIDQYFLPVQRWGGILNGFGCRTAGRHGSSFPMVAFQVILNLDRYRDLIYKHQTSGSRKIYDYHDQMSESINYTRRCLCWSRTSNSIYIFLLHKSQLIAPPRQE